MTVFSGGLFLLVGISLAIMLSAPANVVFGVVVALLGVGGVWVGLTAGNEAPVLYIEEDKPPREFKIEDATSDAEEGVVWKKSTERFLTWVIFGILIILVLTGVWELTAWIAA